MMDYSLKYLTGYVKTGCSNMTLLYSANYLPWLTDKKVVWNTTKKIQVTPRVLSPASNYEGKKVLKQIHSCAILRGMS